MPGGDPRGVRSGFRGRPRHAACGVPAVVLRLLRPVLFALLPLLAGCGADFVYFATDHLSGAGTTTLIVAWRDAPADGAESVRVTLERVEVLGPEGTEVLYEGRQVHDLLTLVNGVTAVVANGEIPAGRWDGLRFVLSSDEVGGAHTVTVGGVVHVLSFARPGAWIVDVQHPMDLAEDEVTEVQVDFNVRLSVYEAAETWYLDPQLSAIDPTGAGGVSGTVRSTTGFVVAGATVSAQQGAWEILSTRAASDGTYRLHPLQPGVYTIVATAPGLAPGVADDVSVMLGVESGGRDLTLTPVVEGGLEGVAPSGRPGLRIRVIGSEGLIALVGVDPVTGAFALPALAPGTYEVQLWDGDALVGTQGGVQVTAGEVAFVDL